MLVQHVLLDRYIPASLAGLSTKDRENDEEEIDNIDVELQGSVHIFLGAHLVLPPTHNHLRVIDQELKYNGHQWNTLKHILSNQPGAAQKMPA